MTSQDIGAILAAILEPLSRGEAVEMDILPETAPIIRTAVNALRTCIFTECIKDGRHFFRITPTERSQANGQ